MIKLARHRRLLLGLKNTQRQAAGTKTKDYEKKQKIMIMKMGVAFVPGAVGLPAEEKGRKREKKDAKEKRGIGGREMEGKNRPRGYFRPQDERSRLR